MVTAISRMNFYSVMRSSPSQFKLIFGNASLGAFQFNSQFKNEVTLNVLNESKYNTC